jgi:hypothetical protein|tara:strand:- start:734 stop:1207 length:474 start_codon:yes stop_codon:yes gene_type:complete
MITNIGKEVVESIIKDDPVRPHLTTDFRTSSNREVYALYEDKYAEQHFPSDDIKAIICVAYTNEVPKNEYELEMFSQAACQDGQRGHIAVFYTVWSYAKGAGRQVVFDVAKHLVESERAKKFVTLSPLTTMAERFHLRNGAELISKHDSCQNFEYTL